MPSRGGDEGPMTVIKCIDRLASAAGKRHEEVWAFRAGHYSLLVGLRALIKGAGSQVVRPGASELPRLLLCEIPECNMGAWTPYASVLSGEFKKNRVELFLVHDRRGVAPHAPARRPPGGARPTFS
jgi:hypothetical protein